MRWLARAGVKNGSNYSSARDSSALCCPLHGLALGSHCPPSACGRSLDWFLKSCATFPENSGVQGDVVVTVDLDQLNITATIIKPNIFSFYYSTGRPHSHRRCTEDRSDQSGHSLRPHPQSHLFTTLHWVRWQCTHSTAGEKKKI